MRSNASWKLKLARILLGAGFVLALVVVRGTHAGNGPVHLATDWSHRRLVFSAPHNLGQHVKFLSNPRYVQQLVRRNSGNAGKGDPKGWRWRRAPEPTPTPSKLLHRDWSAYLGSAGTVGAGRYPAKFSFDVNSASCDTNNSSPNLNNNEDFVVYNTGLVPSAAGTDAGITGTFTDASASNGQFLTITNNNLPAPNSITLFANTGGLSTGSAIVTTQNATPPVVGDVVQLGGVFYAFNTTVGANDNVLIGANAAAAAGNLEAAINDNPSQCVTTAPCFGSQITTPSAAGSATIAGNAVTIRAYVDGAAGTFFLSTNDGTTLPISAYFSGAGANDGANFLIDANPVTSAQNLAAAITRVGGNTFPGIGVTAPVPSTATLTMNSANTGVGGHPGIVDITTVNVDVSGFSWAGSSLTGGSAGASIVAYSNICPGGTGTIPWTYWAYNTGGQAVTSPVLSSDGTQVAFIQNAGATGELVLLKWAPWNGMFPGPPTIDAPVDITDSQATTHTVTAAAYPTCIAPCMTILPFTSGGTITDTNSDPFYDYPTDTLYVGDNGGHLRKFTGVFTGTPLQVSTGGFPVAVTNGGVLTSPVFDEGTGKAFVGSSSGYLNAVLASTGADTVSAQVAGAGGIFDSPILDPINETVYVITSDTNSGTTLQTGIYTFPATFAASSTGTETVISATHPGTVIYDGDFDNAFYSGGAGNMYVCAPAAASNAATLYQIAVSAAGTLGAVTRGPALSTSGTLGCTGVTEFFNSSITSGPDPSGTDLIFLGVNSSAVTAAPIVCPSATGCLMSFDVTSGAALTTSKAPVATLAVPGGPSGVIVDNDVSSATIGTGGGSQVYFTPMSYAYCTSPTTSGSGIGIGGCATQASQAGLN